MDGGLQILVLEDDDDGRQTLGRVLAHGGFAVTAVRHGLAAFEVLDHRWVDGIVCDLKMPELGGLGFFEQLEEKHPHLAARVVFVTAFHDAPEIQRFLDRTGQPYFDKPYDVNELIQALREVIRNASRNLPPPDIV